MPKSLSRMVAARRPRPPTRKNNKTTTSVAAANSKRALGISGPITRGRHQKSIHACFHQIHNTSGNAKSSFPTSPSSNNYNYNEILSDERSDSDDDDDDDDRSVDSSYDERASEDSSTVARNTMSNNIESNQNRESEAGKGPATDVDTALHSSPSALVRASGRTSSTFFNTFTATATATWNTDNLTTGLASTGGRQQSNDEDFGLDLLGGSADRQNHQLLSAFLNGYSPPPPPPPPPPPTNLQQRPNPPLQQAMKLDPLREADAAEPAHTFNLEDDSFSDHSAAPGLFATADIFGQGQQQRQHSKRMVTITSDRIVQTSKGLAVLLDENPSSSSTFSAAAATTTTSAAATANRRFKRWTPEEDSLLKTAVALDGGPPINWKSIARKYFHESRNHLQCKGRWNKALCPGISRAPFTVEEDRVIVARRNEGMSFVDIVSVLPTNRTTDQVRDRYSNTLDPQLKKKVAWSHEEKQVLFQAQKVMGNKWKAIAKLLPGRSVNDVKNQWHNAKNCSRRAMRHLAKKIQDGEELERARGHDEAEGGVGEFEFTAGMDDDMDKFFDTTFTAV